MTDETLIRMPKLADTLVEGTLGRWLKQVGESVGQGEALASIETDKVTTDITSPATGTLLELLVGEGQTVAVETPIARIGDATDVAPAPKPTHVAPAPKTTPLAARILAEPRVEPDTAPLTSMRRAIAEHMTKARQTIPHGQTVMDADLTALVAWREAHKAQFQEQAGAGLTFTVLFVFALARQLAKTVPPPVDVGVAVALDDGLIVPALRHADQLGLAETARGVADLANRARANQLTPDDLQGARMTLTNVGSFGNLTASPIVPLGQLGILGPGVVERRPMPAPDDGIRLGWSCRLSFVFDRRSFDDLSADTFLRGVIAELSGAKYV
jgi:2-oxoglutarate dehydrogenase E2 component (dihydrolipoamide succinyltransferase)